VQLREILHYAHGGDVAVAQCSMVTTAEDQQRLSALRLGINIVSYSMHTERSYRVRTYSSVAATSRSNAV
jgi:hypothetical protein